jgi:prepilin-type N-terminal cleavage/methylation domain-containing protein
MSRALGNERGFSLAEILVAAVIITVGLTAIAGGFQYALSGIEVGKKQTEAAFLAEQKLEQIKADALASYAAMPAYPAEAYGAIAGYPNHRRNVTVTTNPPGAVNTRRIQVSVFYRLLGTYGVALPEREVRIDALVANKD